MPPFNLYDFDSIDWDDEESEGSNLAHCLRWGVDEIVVSEVLSNEPAEIKMKLEAAEYAVAGPDSSRKFWTLLFSRSGPTRNLLRPVTGWPSKSAELAAWEKQTNR